MHRHHTFKKTKHEMSVALGVGAILVVIERKEEKEDLLLYFEYIQDNYSRELD